MAADYERYLAFRTYIMFWMHEFAVSHHIATNKLFKGDAVAASILGEVAQHAHRRFMRELAGPIPDAELLPLVFGSERESVLSPCNALSISYSTGIPRETVRRRVRDLIKEGRLVQDGKRHLRIAPGLSQEFDEFGFEQFQRFLAVAGKLQEIVDLPDAADGSKPAAPSAKVATAASRVARVQRSRPVRASRRRK